MLVYGMSFDQADELCEFGATIAIELFNSFIRKIVTSFLAEYL